jgi:hypothetical protein
VTAGAEGATSAGLLFELGVLLIVPSLLGNIAARLSLTPGPLYPWWTPCSTRPRRRC